MRSRATRSRAEPRRMDARTALLAERREKLERLRALQGDAYPPSFAVTARAGEAKAAFEAGTLPAGRCSFGGRLLSLRDHGKAHFADLQDASGKIQCYFRQEALGERGYGVVRCLDIGDIVGVSGELFRTRAGEVTVRAEEVRVLAKALRPVPVVKKEVVGGETRVHDPFQDKEQRFRHRYLDLLLNPEVRERFVDRSRIVMALRQVLVERGFLEVETPILQPLYGGATARPFTTYHNALGMTLFLRIADELYLKRLLVGGAERVFEIGKDFRNEGIDRLHNPEFTQLELYQAFTDYRDMMSLCEEMVGRAAEAIRGGRTVLYQGRVLDLRPPWRRITFREALEAKVGRDVLTCGEGDLTALLEARGIPQAGPRNRGRLLDALFSHLVEPELVEPTFICDYPRETAPLAKGKRDAPDLVERFEAFLGGSEIANAFTELNDPVEQRERFEEQMRWRAEGDEEAQPLDEEFLRALEYGMPPAGGMGIGIDRLCMILTDAPSLREVILFPHMRPE